MQLTKMVDFIEHNSIEQLKDYYGELKDNIKDTNSTIKRLYFWMVVSGILYYLYRTSAISGVEFSIIKLRNLKLIDLMAAPVFSVMMFFNALLAGRLSDLMHFSKLISFKLYNHGNLQSLDLGVNKYRDYVRLIVPFSISIELAKDDGLYKTRLIDVIFRLPAGLIGLVPLIFTYYLNVKLYSSSGQSSLGMIAFVFTTYINLFTMYRFLSILFAEVKVAGQLGQGTDHHIDKFNS